MNDHEPVATEELAHVASLGDSTVAANEWYAENGPRLLRDLSDTIHERDEFEAERDALAATVERLIREAGAIRLDERQRAKAEHEALEDAGRQRDANRIERLEGELARLRVIVDDADKAKAEHTATRDELRRLHDVLSGKRGPT